MTSIIRSPLCGKQFGADEIKCHPGCPLSKNCDLICCPNCRYTFKGRSELIDFFKSILKRKDRP